MNKPLKVILLSIGFFGMTNLVQAQTAWVAPSSANELKNPFANNEDALKKGKKLYAQNCAICHGDKGKGDGIAGAALKPKPANFTLESIQSQSDGAIFWKLTAGRSPMAAYKEILSEEQRWQLITYIRTLKK
jgi:mono/diheme cytochrome c family protein